MQKIIRFLPSLLYFSIAFSCASTKSEVASSRIFETNQFSKAYFNTFNMLTDGADDGQQLIHHMLKWTGSDNKRRFEKKLTGAIEDLIKMSFPNDTRNIMLSYIFEDITNKITNKLKKYVSQGSRGNRKFRLLSHCAEHSKGSVWLLRYFIKEMGFNINVTNSGGSILSNMWGLNSSKRNMKPSLESLKFILNETNFDPNRMRMQVFSISPNAVRIIHTPLSRIFSAHKGSSTHFSESEKKTILYLMNHPKVKFELHKNKRAKSTVLDFIYECMQSCSEKTNFYDGGTYEKDWDDLSEFWDIALEHGGRFKVYVNKLGNEPNKPERPILHNQQQFLSLTSNNNTCLVM